VEKLANYVALGESVLRYSWISVEQSSFSLLSLSSYDQWKQNVNPNLKFQVKTSEDKSIVNGHFTSASTPPLHNSLFFEETGNGKNISFVTSGQGEASVVLGLNFIPLKLNPDPIYRGIVVQKVIQRIDQNTYNAIGTHLTNVGVGSKVKVTIQVTIPDDSPSVRVVDPVPAGLEPLDESFFNFETGNNNNQFYGHYYYFYCFLSSFSHREYHKDKVIFEGQNLFAGTYTVSYVAIANVAGEFSLPPTKAYDTRQPEVMGLSASGSFKTKTIINIPNDNPSFEKQVDNKLCIEYNHTLYEGSIETPTISYGAQIFFAIALMIIVILI